MDLVPYCWACTLQDVWEILQVQVVLEDLEDPDARRNQCQVVQAVLLVLGGLAQSLPLDPTIKDREKYDKQWFRCFLHSETFQRIWILVSEPTGRPGFPGVPGGPWMPPKRES